MTCDSVVRAERIKLWAAWLNNMSVACFTAGTIGPFFSVVGTTPGEKTVISVLPLLPNFFFHMLVGQLITTLFIIGIAFRLAARRALNGLQVPNRPPAPPRPPP